MMSEKSLLYIDDDKASCSAFSQSVEAWNSENAKSERVFFPIVCGSISEAKQALYRYRIDGALVDLRLPEDVGGRARKEVGNSLAKDLLHEHGVPLAIVSGYPSEVSEELVDLGLIESFNKGDSDGHDKAIAWLAEKWPMMEILRSAKAKFDASTAEIFVKRIWPQWVDFSSISGEQSKIADVIARQYVFHIGDKLGLDLDENVDWHPFECFTIPSYLDHRCHTGDVFLIEENLWVVLSPQCDMANQNIANVIMAKCDIKKDEWSEIVKLSKDDSNENKKEKAGKKLRDFMNQNTAQSKHYLPPLPGEDGPLVVLFSDIITKELKWLNENLGSRRASVSAPFLGNLTQRFGAYISRTGQPNIDINHL